MVEDIPSLLRPAPFNAGVADLVLGNVPLAAGNSIIEPNEDGPAVIWVNSVEVTMSPSPSCINVSERGSGSMTAEAVSLWAMCDHADATK